MNFLGIEQRGRLFFIHVHVIRKKQIQYRIATTRKLFHDVFEAGFSYRLAIARTTGRGIELYINAFGLPFTKVQLLQWICEYLLGND